MTEKSDGTIVTESSKKVDNDKDAEHKDHDHDNDKDSVKLKVEEK